MARNGPVGNLPLSGYAPPMRITDGAPPHSPETADAPHGDDRSAAVPPAHGAALCVLASSSGGNCTILRWTGPDGKPHACLIDLGLSPRRTRAGLAACGLSLANLDAVILTHLDTDHCHAGWSGKDAALFTDADAALPRSVRLHLAHSHIGRATRAMLNAGRFLPFKSHIDLPGEARVRVLMNSHDELGTACFRIAVGGGELGFATDLGHATDALVDHLRGVDVLAIESNYCPKMQLESDRPAALKDRIMGGGGHLSNEQTARAVHAIEPRSHVVLLHLSRQCNTPELAAAHHEGADYALTIAHHDRPTRWVRIGPPVPVVSGGLGRAASVASANYP